MENFTTKQMKLMSEALDFASIYFADDTKHFEKIVKAQAQIAKETQESYLLVRDYICNLQLISIAETGFDLNKKSYCLKYPALAARAQYITFARTDKGIQILNELKIKHADVVLDKR